MKLLSLSLTAHDSNMSYYDGNVVHYIKLERLTRQKRFSYDNLWQWKYDINKIWGVDYKDLDEIVVNYNVSDAKTTPPLAIPSINKYCKELQTVVDLKHIKNPNEFSDINNVSFISHHYAHSLSTWMIEPNPELSIVIDGLGDGRTWSVYRGDDLIDSGGLECGSIGFHMKEIGISMGVQYSHRNDIAGKLMAIQTYGNVDENYLKLLREYDMRSIKHIFSYNMWRKYKNDDFIAEHTRIDWLKTIHVCIADILVKFFKQYATPEQVISYSGGIAQNVIWNTELKRNFPNLVIPPHAADDGISLGGIEYLRKKHNLQKFTLNNFPYNQCDVCPKTEPDDEVITRIANMLAAGKIVCWYQGNGEVGPRALGNRSILFNPKIFNGKEIINSIKRRENYRPFGASVLEEYCSDYFDLMHKDEYMLYTANVKVNNLHSITHIDNTCRVQTVGTNNKSFRKLLEKFYEITGCAVLLNTSLNLAGKPICGYPEEALELFNNSNVDCLVIGNTYYTKGSN